MSSWYPLNWLKRESDALQVQERDYISPTKIFVENDGPLYPNRHEPKRDVFEEGDARIAALLDGFYAPQNYLSLFYSLPEIFAPIHEIASRVADATWQLVKYNVTNNEEKIDFNNEAFNRLFEQPNPLQSHRQLVYQSVVYEILTGRTIWHLNIPANIFDNPMENVLTWSNLPAHQVKIIQKKADPYTATDIGDFIQEYRLPGGDGRNRIFPPEQVMPLLHTDFSKPHDLNSSIPLIKGADKAIRNLIPVYEARGTIYIKRGALGLWVNRGKDGNGTFVLNDAERKVIEAMHQADYGITGGKRPTGITSADVDFVRSAMSISELQPFDESLSDAVAIYKVLQVPRHLVPSKDNSTFDNADTDMKSFYTGVIIPWAKKYGQIWTNRFELKRIKRYINPDFSHIEILQENKKEKADVDKVNGETWMNRWKNGACTLNDWIDSFEGTRGIGPVYEKKIFELTPEEREQVMELIGKKPKENEKESSPANSGAKASERTN